MPFDCWLKPNKQNSCFITFAIFAVIVFSLLIPANSGAEVSSGATGGSINDEGKYGNSDRASWIDDPWIDEVRINGVATPASPIPLKQIDLGQSHACVLDSAGKVSCWGDDANGQVSGWNMPYADETLTSISAGNHFTCGTKTDGSALCWGYPFKEDGTRHEENNRTFSAWDSNPEPGYTGWVDNPDSTVYFKSGTLSIGNYHACAIRTSGEIACWGKAGNDRLIVPKDSSGRTITDWVQVEAGWAQTCAVRADGSAVCWGRSTFGRSDGPSGSGPYKKATTSVYNGCALATDGSVDCWGSDHTAFDPVRDSLVPPANARFSIIEMSTANGFWYGCGILMDGDIQCWGVADDTSVLSPPAGKFSSISVGSANSCAIDTEGYAHCWGASDDGLLTDLPSGPFSQVDGGLNYSCALRASGEVVCWGTNHVYLDDNGAVVGSTGNLDAPSGSHKYLAVGNQHGCAIGSSGTVTCWGGKGADGNAQAWAVAPTGTFSTLDAGPDITCGVKTDGTLECWGESTHNRLTEPTGNFTAVAVGATHICAIKSDQSVECWGQAFFFDREGDNTPDDIDGRGNHTSTTPPSGSHQYTDITAGEGHTCAIRTDNKIVCWGYHADGRNKVPGWEADSQAFSNVDFDAIATGGLTNCGILSSNGGLSCWNDEKRQYHPDADTLALTGFTKIGAGPNHMLAIRGDGSLAAWGIANPSSVPSIFRPSAQLLSVQVVSQVQFIAPGNRLRFEARFDRPVIVEGIPQLSFMLDDTTRHASYVGGNPSSTLYFEYVLSEEDGGKTRLSTESSQLVFESGSSIMGLGTNRPTTTLPIATPEPIITISYNLVQAKISRIEPTIRSVTVGSGDRIRLGVDVYGAQDIKDNSLAYGIGFSWSDDGGGGNFEGNGHEVTYTSPDQPGTYTISVATPFSDCRAPATDEIRCEATFEIRVRRPPAAQPEAEAPVNPPGEVPSILVDGDGNQYEVFTPVEGGTFSSESYSITAAPGVVPNGEFIGVRMSDEGAASNVGMTDQRYTLSGNMYRIHAVDGSGAAVSSYVLDDAATVCVPLPDELRANTPDLAVVAINGDGSLTILSTQVRISTAGTMVCGGLSNLPASVAIGSAGAPIDFPTATPESTPAAPDTGGAAPASNIALLALLFGIVAVVIGTFIAISLRRRWATASP